MFDLYEEAAKKLKEDAREEAIRELKEILEKQFQKEDRAIELNPEGLVVSYPTPETAEMWRKVINTYDSKTLRITGLKNLDLKPVCEGESLTFSYVEGSKSMFAILVKTINSKLEEDRKLAKEYAKKCYDVNIPKAIKDAYFSEDGNFILIKIKNEIPEVGEKVIQAAFKEAFKYSSFYKDVVFEDGNLILMFDF